MSSQRFVVIDGIKAYQARCIRIVDILRNGKAKGELSVRYTVRTQIKRFLAVIELEGLFRLFLIIPLAGDEVLGISHGCRNNTLIISFSLYMSGNPDYRTCLHFR